MTGNAASRALVLTTETPLPPNGGYRLRVLHLARQLTQAAPVEVAALGPVPDAAGEPFSLIGVPHDVSRARALMTSMTRPYLAARVRSRGATELATARRWDVVQVESPWLVRSALAAGVPIVLDAHNVEADIVRTLAAEEGRTLHRLRWRWEAAKTARAETPAVAAADVVAACSVGDAEVLAAAGARRTIVVPNGVDTRGIEHRLPGEGTTLLYVGQLGYRPNEAAVIELVDKVLPRVAAGVPDAIVRVVGPNASPAIRRLSSPSVELAGEVPDVAAELHAARALVVPLRAGSGTRLKILEAMAAGTPIVSTPLGAAGIAAEDGRHLLLGETPAELAAQAVRLLRDPGLGRSLSAEARRLVEQRYDWSVTAEPLLEIHQELAGRRASGR